MVNSIIIFVYSVIIGFLLEDLTYDLWMKLFPPKPPRQRYLR